jgi:hypothetical protein
MKADPALPGSDLYPQSKGDPEKGIFTTMQTFSEKDRG